jgi:hypothetical protein
MTTAPPVSAAVVPGVVATVSGNDLLTRLDTLATGQARIEAALSNVPQQIADLRAHDERLAARLDVLERWRAFWTGATAVVVLLLTSGVVAALLTALHRGQ